MLKALARRRNFLDQRLRERGRNGESFDLSERNALNWALAQLSQEPGSTVSDAVTTLEAALLNSEGPEFEEVVDAPFRALAFEALRKFAAEQGLDASAHAVGAVLDRLSASTGAWS